MTSMIVKSSARKGKRGIALRDTRPSVEKVQLMRYEGGQPEPRPTVGDISAAWAVILALIFGFLVFSFI